MDALRKADLQCVLMELECVLMELEEDIIHKEGTLFNMLNFFSQKNMSVPSIIVVGAVQPVQESPSVHIGGRGYYHYKECLNFFCLLGAVQPVQESPSGHARCMLMYCYSTL